MKRSLLSLLDLSHESLEFALRLAAVIDGPTSVVFDQADNRLHTQKALLLMLLAPEHCAC